MQKIKETAEKLNKTMTWSEELTPELRPATKVAKVLNGLLESDMEINRKNIELLIEEIVKLNKPKYKDKK